MIKASELNFVAVFCLLPAVISQSTHQVSSSAAAGAALARVAAAARAAAAAAGGMTRGISGRYCARRALPVACLASDALQWLYVRPRQRTSVEEQLTSRDGGGEVTYRRTEG
jgi:hypothetical protein